MLTEEEKRRRIELLQQQKGPLAMQQYVAQRATPPPVTQTPTSNITQGPITDAVNFIAPWIKPIGKGLGEFLAAGNVEKARQVQQQSIEQGNRAIQSFNQRLQNPNITAEERARYQNAVANIAKSNISTAQSIGNLAEAQKYNLDQNRIAGAYSQAALDALTAGLGTKVVTGLKGLSTLGKVTTAAKAVVPAAAIGAGYGVTGTAIEKGSQATPQEYLQNAGLAAGVGGAIPGAAGLVARFGKPVQNFISNLVSRAANAAEGKAGQAAGKAVTEAERIAAQNAAREAERLAAQKVAQEAAQKTAIKSASIVPDTVVNKILIQKQTADIEAAVRNVFPKVDVPSFNTAVQEITNAADAPAVRTILDTLHDAKIATEAVIPSTVVPTTSTEIRAAQLAQEVQQPTGLTRLRTAPEAPQAPAAPQVTPTAVQGAQSVTAVPEAKTFAQLTAENVAAAEQAKTKYGKPTFKRKALEVFDPRQAAVKLDRLANAALKAQGKTLNSIDRLDLVLQQSAQSTAVAQDFLKNSNIAQVLGKYGYDTPAANQFNQYRLLKRDIELVKDGRKPIFQNMDLAQKEAFVAQYEKANPSALSDLKKVVADINKVQDMTVSGPNAFLDKAQLEAARTKKDGTKYQFYTPYQRALPQDVERAMMSGQNLAGLGQQKVLREMTGSDIPPDIKFNALTDYVETIFRQLGNARVQRVLEQRVKAGLVPGAKFLQTGEQTAQIAAQKALIEDATNMANKLKTRVNISARQERRLASEMSQLQKAGATEAIKTAGKPGIKLTPTGRMPSTKKIFESLIKTDTANLVRIKNKIANREPKLAAKIDEVIAAKDALAQAKLTKKTLKQELVDIQPDPTTGLQTIIGRDINGNTYRIELPPEYANLLMGYNKQQLIKLLKLTRAAQEPFRQAWVGIGAPQFQLSTAVWNAMMAPIISREGYKLLKPSIAKSAVKALFGKDEMTNILKANGAVSFGGNLDKLTSDSTAAALAAQNGAMSKMKWFTELEKGAGFRRVWGKLNEYGGRIDQATRAAAATSAYNSAIKRRLTKEQAIAEALYEWNNVLPDYSNMSYIVRSIDAAVPFTAASVAGTRTLLRAFRDRPIQTAAKIGVAGTGIAALYGYNLSTEAGQKFYEDMKASKKDYLLDNNLIIVMPGAKKDEATGEWSGIVKIPVAPELRSINKGVRESIYEISKGNGIPVGTVGLSLFDFFTGKLRDQSSPLYTTGVTLSTGVDPRTGRQVYDNTMTDAEKQKAVAEYVRRNLGVPGQMAGGNAWNEFVGGFMDRVYGAKGSTPGSRYYLNQDSAIKSVGLDKNELAAYFGTVAPATKDLSGNVIRDKTYYDSASKAITYLRYPKTFEVSKQIDALSRAQGNPGDPLYDLPPEQLKVVLNMQANYSPGNFEDKATLQLNPWLADFNKKRGEYFDGILKVQTENLKSLQDKLLANPNDKNLQAQVLSLSNYVNGVDPMGIKVPTASPELQKKIQQSMALTGADKAQFYADNPEVSKYFQDQNDYTRVKRAFMGLPQFDNYPQPSKEVQSYMDQYNALPKQNGPLKRDGTPSSPDRAAWIQANPNQWALMTDQWNKQTIYNLQREGAKAVYEGIDIPQKTLDKLGLTQQQFQNLPYVERQYLTDFLSAIAVPQGNLPTIKAKQVKQYKLKLPATSGKNIRIKLQ